MTGANAIRSSRPPRCWSDTLTANRNTAAGSLLAAVSRRAGPNRLASAPLGGRYPGHAALEPANGVGCLRWSERADSIRFLMRVFRPCFSDSAKRIVTGAVLALILTLVSSAAAAPTPEGDWLCNGHSGSAIMPASFAVYLQLRASSPTVADLVGGSGFFQERPKPTELYSVPIQLSGVRGSFSTGVGGTVSITFSGGHQEPWLVTGEDPFRV